MLAARYGYTAVARTLLMENNVINICEDSNQMQLHYAASHNQVEMIDFLISR